MILSPQGVRGPPGTIGADGANGDPVSGLIFIIYFVVLQSRNSLLLVHCNLKCSHNYVTADSISPVCICVGCEWIGREARTTGPSR